MITLFKIFIALILQQGFTIAKADQFYYPVHSVQSEQAVNMLFTATARAEDINEMLNLVSLANEPYFVRDENISPDQTKVIVLEFANLKPENKKRLFELLKPFEKRIRMDWNEIAKIITD